MARDVRELAQRSASAAKEIKLLIDTPNQQVQDGVQLVGETGNALQVIVAEVQEINRHVSSIVETAHEQSSGLKQILAQFRLGGAAHVSVARGLREAGRISRKCLGREIATAFSDNAAIDGSKGQWQEF